MKRGFIIIAIPFALMASACPPVPPRDALPDRRINEDFDRTVPDTPIRPSEAPAPYIAGWVRDLDNPDETSFALAKARLRRSGNAACEALCGESFPKTARGVHAAIEILMLTPPDKATQPQMYAAFHKKLIEIVTTDSAASSTPDALAMRLETLNALEQRNDADDPPIFAGRMLDSRREVRWAAAWYFKRQPARLTKEILTGFIDTLEHPDADVRADAGRLLVDLHSALTPEDKRDESTAAFSPVAPQTHRAQQVAWWRAWLAKDAERLLAAAKQAPPEKSGGKSVDDQGPERDDKER